MARRHQGDAWGRGSYSIPENAVMGASHTGSYSDSPAPTADIKKELNDFRKVLRSKKIKSRLTSTQSGNVFMNKVWVVVGRGDFPEARKLALKYLDEHESDTEYIHDAGD